MECLNTICPSAETRFALAFLLELVRESARFTKLNEQIVRIFFWCHRRIMLNTIVSEVRLNARSSQDRYGCDVYGRFEV
jgi:hypothetical protein